MDYVDGKIIDGKVPGATTITYTSINITIDSIDSVMPVNANT